MIWKIDLIVSVVELWALPMAIKRELFKETFYQKEKKWYLLDEENLIQPLFIKQGQRL